jgi:two-component sensor histidine kinase
MAAIHKQLYDTEGQAWVKLDEVLRSLTENVMYAMGKDPGRQLKLNSSSDRLSVEKAVTFSLVLNEIITNACKYGLPGPDAELIITAGVIGEDITIVISDEGPGIPEEHREGREDSLGMYLIGILSRQLNARYSWEKQGGRFNFTLRFKVHE